MKSERTKPQLTSGLPPSQSLPCNVPANRILGVNNPPTLIRLMSSCFVRRFRPGSAGGISSLYPCILDVPQSLLPSLDGIPRLRQLWQTLCPHSITCHRQSKNGTYSALGFPASQPAPSRFLYLASGFSVLQTSPLRYSVSSLGIPGATHGPSRFCFQNWDSPFHTRSFARLRIQSGIPRFTYAPSRDLYPALGFPRFHTAPSHFSISSPWDSPFYIMCIYLSSLWSRVASEHL
jgi:hypothetical protein